MTAMRILILGANGFLGGHVLRHVSTTDSDIRVLVSKIDLSFTEEHPDVEVNIGDLTDERALKSALSGVDVVVHAASKNIDIDGTGFTDINVHGTARLCRAACDAGVRKFIYISSVGVYGHGIHRNADEDTPLAPDTPFSRSKADAEQLVLKHHYAGDFQAIILRHRFVYGDRDVYIVPRIMHVVHRYPFFINQGRAHLSFISAADFAKTIYRFIQWEGDLGSPFFNVTDGLPISYRDVVNTLCVAFGMQLPKRSIPYHLLYGPVRLYEKLNRIDPERIAHPLSSIRMKMCACDNYFSNRKLTTLMPELKFHSFSEGIDRSFDFYKKFVQQEC